MLARCASASLRPAARRVLAPRVLTSSPLTARGFRATAPRAVLEADASNSINKAYHAGNLALVGLAPLAIIAHPSGMSMPVDVALSVALPFHAHVGMNYIISDYIPKGMRGGARVVLLGVSAATVAGLLSLSFSDDGIVGTLKRLWGWSPAAAAEEQEQEQEEEEE